MGLKAPVIQGEEIMVKSYKVWLLTAWFISVFSIVQLSVPAKTSAQEQTSEGGREAAALGTMTVTAEKQEQNVQDVSVAITVMDALDIEDKKIESLPDIIDFVPNMAGFSDQWGLSNMVSLRGVSAPFILKDASAVGMYVDGVPTLGTPGLAMGTCPGVSLHSRGCLG